MRKLLAIIAVAGMACAAMGGEYRAETVTITGTLNVSNIANSVTSRITGVWGELVKIEIDETVAGADVDIDITAISSISTLTAVTLYSADDVTADAVIFPAIDRTDAAGAALTSDEPGPYTCANEELRVVVSDWNATGQVFTVRFVFRDAD